MTSPALVLFVFFGFGLLGPVAQAGEVTASDLCQAYAKKSAGTNSLIAEIQRDCRIPQQTLKDKGLPVFNFRPVFGAGDGAPRIFRGGQPLGDSASDPNVAVTEARKRDFDVKALRSRLGSGAVVSLRFDRHYRPWKETFADEPLSLPLSPGEAPYRYASEKKLVESLGLRSVYLPTLPELEHFVGNYVPRLDSGPGSKPYFCRLPQKFPDGANPHWVNDSREYSEHAAEWAKKGVIGPLVSADPECRDLYPVYGKARVRSWLKQVRAVVHQADSIFWKDAESIERLARKGKVLFHCSSGTDRAGIVAMILESRHDHLTRGELKKYRGPGSDPKIDLISLHYLMSSWAGTSPKYRYLFPAGGRPGLITKAVR